MEQVTSSTAFNMTCSTILFLSSEASPTLFNGAYPQFSRVGHLGPLWSNISSISLLEQQQRTKKQYCHLQSILVPPITSTKSHARSLGRLSSPRLSAINATVSSQAPLHLFTRHLHFLKCTYL